MQADTIFSLKSEYNDLDKYKSIFDDIFYCKKDTYTLHNPYGPAIIRKNGGKQYCIEGKCHRLDGPAVIYYTGYKEYWINHELLSKEQFELHPERLKYLGKEYLICLG